MNLEPIHEAFAPCGITDSQACRLKAACGDATAREVADKTAELLPGLLRSMPSRRAVALLCGSDMHAGELAKFFHSPDALRLWRCERQDRAAADRRAEERAAELRAIFGDDDKTRGSP